MNRMIRWLAAAMTAATLALGLSVSPAHASGNFDVTLPLSPIGGDCAGATYTDGTNPDHPCNALLWSIISSGGEVRHGWDEGSQAAVWMSGNYGCQEIEDNNPSNDHDYLDPATNRRANEDGHGHGYNPATGRCEQKKRS